MSTVQNPQQRELLTQGERNLYRAVEEGKALSGAEVIYLLEAIKAARACSDEWEAQTKAALAALREAVDFADEGWAYASDYFIQKWDYHGQRAKLVAVLEGDPA